jgi:dTDP-4-dehydrorhamnose 3,5-epimerase
MIWTPTLIQGCFILDLEKKIDERGFFARSFCEEEFSKKNIPFHIVQSNISRCNLKGTIRGLHYQENPYCESKLMQCTKGKIFDVIIDLRKNSPTYKKWVGVNLDAESNSMVLIPELCAHGYQSLVDDTEVFYSTTYAYTPKAELGIRYNDKEFGIKWPVRNNIIVSVKDDNWPDYGQQEE